ncbi:homoserine kinase [Baaleninema simplex]|uniref:homoserine kinase n=1 Tax=Baaleninema simplex TaxID=2862350 RepID=UPI000344B072|nr:homoserine kinase [Baaleninema simplex]
MTNTVTVTVPATTANLGPGFDCLGAALTLYNTFEFSPLKPKAGQLRTFEIAVRGLESERVTTDDSNLVYRVFAKLFEKIDRPIPPVRIEISLGIPLARGLGSSATAIVGGSIGANQLAGNPLSRHELMRLAISIEGHPDNVVPALLGGCQLAASDDLDWSACEIAWHPDVVPVVAIPEFELSTAEARRVLPDLYSRSDTVFNTAHLGLLVKGLETGNRKWLTAGMLDRVHQPYRQKLITGYAAVRAAAIAAGAYGMAISGAGPTLLALTSRDRADRVVEAMKTAWDAAGTTAFVRSLQIDTKGAKLQIN